MSAGVVDVAFCTREDAAVIGVVEDNRVVTNARVVELFHPLSDLPVHCRDDVHVGDPVLANLRRIRVMRWKRDRGRIATGDLRDEALFAVAFGLVPE